MSEGGSKSKNNNKKSWFSQSSRGGPSGGGRGGGRGRGRGGRGGRGGGPGRFEGGAGSIEGASAPQQHLGRYRDRPLPEMMEQRGILATAVKDKERSAERELMEALERVADELYPETIEKQGGDDDDEDVDMEEMLERELAGMKTDDKSKRFRLCMHETICVFYVTVLEPLDPNVLVRRILEQTEETAKCPFRYLNRIVPISSIANATLPALRTAAQPVMEEGFETGSKKAFKYGIMTNSRSSNKLDKMDMIKTVANLVTNLDQGHSVDLKNQDKTVILELYKAKVGISVVSDYYRFCKYNVIQLAQQTAAKREKEANPDNAIPTDSTGTEEILKQSQAAPKHAARKRKAEEMAQSDSPSRAKRTLEEEDKGDISSKDAVDESEPPKEEARSVEADSNMPIDQSDVEVEII